ncbi:MAG: AAA family ATPase [Deltaproteobacteria bacterium]|nr:MAG: AAA family ATPase [Deltaproteobacteria bacterium]
MTKENNTQDTRYLQTILEDHLKKHRQMVFIVGPRQVGKTTIAQSFLKSVIPGTNSFNWDVPTQRKTLLKTIFQGHQPLRDPNQNIIVFDEIHKYPRWKNALKGLFDTHQPETHWIITGSASLNVYRKGQDSLLGRYFTYHLFPFSVAELIEKETRNSLTLESILKNPTQALQNQKAQEARTTHPI